MRQMSATTQLLASFAMTAAAVAAAFALPVAAHATTISIFGGDDPKVVGSGHMVNQQRKLGNFTTLRIDGPVDVEAHPGANPGVTVHTDDNIEPLIETAVEGDALVVRFRQGTSFRTSQKVYVEVIFATLNAARQQGSGDLHITALNSPKFDSSIAGSGDLRMDEAQVGSFAVGIAGSGDVTLSGHADEARFSIAGSGDIRAAKFAARKVSVSISGSGDAHVNATDSLDARVAGSGDVLYAGHPHDVTRHVAGSGSVKAD